MPSRPATATKAVQPVSDHKITHTPDSFADLSTGVVSPSCRENNLVSSKRGALIVIKAILGRPIDEDLLIGPGGPEIHETVVAAEPVKATQGVQVEQAD